MAYFDLDWSPKFGFGRARNIKNLIGVCVHTSEGSNPNAPASATALANYQINSKTGSYHVIVDQSGQRLRCNTDDWQTWSTGNKGNDILCHLAFTAYSSWSRDKWLSEERMLRGGASVVAHWLKTYGWPNRKVGVAGLPGIVGHVDTRAWGSTDHTDPGPNFPWDVFGRMVDEAMHGTTPTIPPKETQVTPEQYANLDHKLNLLLAQLGPWPQLGQNAKGQNLTLVDAVAELKRSK